MRIGLPAFSVLLAAVSSLSLAQEPLPLRGGQSAGRTTPADLRLQRLETLADLWGKLYLFHPYVVVRERDFEKVLIEAIPRIEAARSTDDFVAALNTHLFAPLGDPLAFVQRTPGTETRRQAKGVRRISATTVYWDAADPSAFTTPAFLRRAVTDLRAIGVNDTLIVDLRWPSPRGDRPYIYGLGALGLFVQSSIRAGYHVARQHQGWEERGALSCQVSTECYLYRQLWQVDAAHWIEPVKGDQPHSGQDSDTRFDSLKPIPVRTAFLVNNSSVLHQDLPLDALQRQENIAVVWEKTGPFTEWGVLRYPEDMEARLGTSMLVSQSGALGFRPDLIREHAVSDRDLVDVVHQAFRAKRERGQDSRPRFDHQMRVPPARPFSSRPLSREERLLGLFKIWTVIRYFNPHLEHASIDWTRMLPAWIPRVEGATDLKEYVWVLREIGAKLNDNHVRVQHPDVPLGPPFPDDLSEFYKPPVLLQRVQGRVVVAEVRPGPSDTISLSPGEEVLAVDGRSVAAVEAQARLFISASTPQGFDKMVWDAQSNALKGPENSTVELTVRGDSGTRRVLLRRSLRATWAATRERKLAPRDPTLVRELDENLGYINAYLLPNAAAVSDAMAEVGHTDGLILDLRAYPLTSLFDLARLLTNRPLRWPIAEVPVVTFHHGPERPLCCGRLRPVAGALAPLEGPRYLKPVVVLINGVPHSHPETVAMFLRQRPDTRFVGTATTGTTGNTTHVSIPSGATFGFTGEVFYHPDGTRFQNIGILPDVLVEPTIQGIRERRDEILEKGVEVLRQMVASRRAR